MVFFNHATRQMTAKIVYYGPGLCGKTTNLNAIYAKTANKARGEMVSLNTETDRTLFFDLLPMDVGVIGGFKAKLQLYTVPGQVFYNSTRKLVLKGVDGIVFVVDSQTAMLDANRESVVNLRENLREIGVNLSDIPMVFQWNKRDLRNVVPVEELERELNPTGMPSFESVAQDGTGVFETLRGITRLALAHIKAHHLTDLSAQPRETQRIEVPPPAAVAMDAAELEGDLPDEPQDEVPAEVATPAEADPSAPTPIQALSLEDLPSASEILEASGDPQPSAPAPGPAPLPDEDREEAPAPLPMRSAAEVIEAVLGDPSPVAPPPLRAAPPLPHFTVPAPPARPRPPGSKAAIDSLLGELSQVGRLGAPTLLRLDLPAEVGPGEIEVVVQVRQGDQTLAEGRLTRAVPGKGIAAKVSVELKRH